MSTAAVMNPSAFQSLPIKLIDESPTNPRKHFDEEALKELAESLRSLGPLQPVLVRPSKGGRYELVFGHRRLRAAKLAGLEQMQAIVRELTDLAVLKAQLVENLRRTDIHALEEAEGYRRLHVDHKLSVDEIAQETGKSKATIHARLKLCELAGPCRKAFEAGEISMSIALELARVKIPSAEQPKVVEELLGGKYSDGPLSYREAVEFLRERFMLDLKKATFDTTDPNLVKSAGACTTCPHRTGNQKDLFADVKNADVCTKPVCHAEKVEADWQAKAKAGEEGKGPKVISAKDAKTMFATYGGLKHSAGVLDLDAPCYEDPKHRTYRQLIGTDAKKEGAVMMARDPHDGKVVELVPAGPAKKLLKEKLPAPRKPPEPSPQQKAAESRARKADEVKDLVKELSMAAVVARAEKDLDRKLLVLLVIQELDMGDGIDAWARRGWPDAEFEGVAEQTKRVEKLPVEQLRGLLAELIMVNAFRYEGEKAAVALGLDMKKLEAKAKKQLEAKEAAKGKCSQCGCTDTKPCKEGCAWVNGDETLCTACVEPNHDDKVQPKKGGKPGPIIDVEDGETEEAAETRHKAKKARK